MEVYTADGVLLKRLEPRVGLVEALALKWPRLAAANHKGELWLIDLETSAASLMNRGEYGLITDRAWHPPGRWLAYAKPAGVYVQNIRLYDAAGGGTYDVTSPTAYDYSPSFDPEGRFLYFLSRRALNPSMDPVQFVYSFAKPSKPYLVALRRGDPSPTCIGQASNTASEICIYKKLRIDECKG